jgi:hypothetical protein
MTLSTTIHTTPDMGLWHINVEDYAAGGRALRVQLGRLVLKVYWRFR